MKWNESQFNWATFFLEWWASTPPRVSSQFNPAVIWPQCLLPAIQKEKMRKPMLFFFFWFVFYCRAWQKRGRNLFLEFHPKGCSGMLHMLTNCWLFSRKDNDLHCSISCLSWDSRHLLKCSPSCWSRHTWSNSIKGTHLSCRYHIHL